MMSLFAAMLAMLVCGSVLGGAITEAMRWSINSPLFNKSMMIKDFIASGIVFFISVANCFFVLADYKDATEEIERLESIIKDD